MKSLQSVESKGNTVLKTCIAYMPLISYPDPVPDKSVTAVTFDD